MDGNDFNLRCEHLRQNLVKLIEDAELPVAAVWYIWKDITSNLEKTYYGALNQATIPEQIEEIKSIKENE